MYAKNRWLILTMVASALFLIVIDMTVLYTALPRLTQALDASASQKLWIVNAYPLVVAGLLPGAGMLSDRIGHKRLFLAGLPVFAVASLCAAFSPTAEWLIAARVFLAVGAAMMMPATLSIVRHVFTDERERALAIGIWASVASGGAAIGPVVGGLLLEYFWWGSVFLINVPVVLLVWPLAWKLIPRCGGDNPRPSDIVGSVQIMMGLVGAIYALKELSKPTPDVSALLVAALIGVLFLVLFVRRQQRSAHPMIDFSLFRNRLFAGGIGVALLSMVALIGVELVLSQRLQLVLGLSPLQAALFILPIRWPRPGGARSRPAVAALRRTQHHPRRLCPDYPRHRRSCRVVPERHGAAIGQPGAGGLWPRRRDHRRFHRHHAERAGGEVRHGGVHRRRLLRTGWRAGRDAARRIDDGGLQPQPGAAGGAAGQRFGLRQHRRSPAAGGRAGGRSRAAADAAGALGLDRAFITVLIAAALLMALGAGAVKLALRK